MSPVTSEKTDGRRSAAAAPPAREGILDATRALFDARGVRDAQIEDIARSVGINRGDHLPALLRQGGAVRADPGRLPRRARGRLAAADDTSASPTARLRGITGAFIDYGIEFPAFVDCAQTLMRRPGPELLEEVSEGAVYRLGRGIASCLAHVAEVLQAGVDEGTFHTPTCTCSRTRCTRWGSAACSWPGSGCSSRRPRRGTHGGAALPEQLREHMVATSIAMAVGPPA